MADDMLGYSRPFREVAGNLGSVLIVVFYACAEAVKHLRSRRFDVLTVFVGRLERVAFGVVLVRVKILEDAVYVNGMLSAVSSKEGRVVIARVWDLH